MIGRSLGIPPRHRKQTTIEIENPGVSSPVFDHPLDPLNGVKSISPGGPEVPEVPEVVLETPALLFATTEASQVQELPPCSVSEFSYIWAKMWTLCDDVRF